LHNLVSHSTMSILHNPPHLTYYHLLEKDLEDCFRYVEPCVAHHNVYSEQFSRIILMAAAEIENILREFHRECKKTGQTQVCEAKNVGHWHGVVTAKFPKFSCMRMVLPRYQIDIRPWLGWTATTAPDWWTNGYNKIKHNRIDNPGAASLIRAVSAVAGLQVALLHYYRLTAAAALVAGHPPQLVVPYDDGDPSGGAGILWNFCIPDDTERK
jgi:hypothetical protein